MEILKSFLPAHFPPPICIIFRGQGSTEGGISNFKIKITQETFTLVAGRNKIDIFDRTDSFRARVRLVVSLSSFLTFDAPLSANHLLSRSGPPKSFLFDVNEPQIFALSPEKRVIYVRRYSALRSGVSRNLE